MLALALIVAAIAALRGMWSPCGLSMLSSLNPVSETVRGNRFWLTAIWYIVGAVVGGALLGAGCAVAASGYARLDPSVDVTWAIAGGAALVALASDTAVFGRSLPDHPRQVDERWLGRYRRWIYAGGFGVQIGAGFATYIMTAAVYLLAVLAVLTGSAAQAGSIAVSFGFVRGLTILLAASARTPDRLRAAQQRIAAFAALSVWMCLALCATVAITAGYVLGGALLTGVVALAVVVLIVLASLRPRAVSS